MNKKDKIMIACIGAICMIFIYVGAQLYHLSICNATQLGYAGSIIGGGITLLGVWWTLNEQQKQFKKNLEEQKKVSNLELAESRRQFEENIKLQKFLSAKELNESKRQFNIELQKKNDELKLLKQQRKEELSLLYQPILSVDIVKKKAIKELSKELFLRFKHPTIICQDYTSMPFVLRIKNIGRGEVKELTADVSNCEIVSSSLSNQDEFDFSNSYILGDPFFNFIPINEERYIHICIPSFTSLTDEDYFIRIMVELKITIVGFIGEYEYEYYVKFFLHIEDSGKWPIIEHDSLSIKYISPTQSKHA